VPSPAEVLEHLHPLLSRQLGFMFGFGPSTDDAVQESLVAILEALPSFRGDARIETWATRIALRTAWRMLKRERRAAPVEPPEETYEIDYVRRAELRRLLEALESLSPKKREAFVLMELFDFTAQEAGRALGTFANTAASRCRHARAELSALLTNSGGSLHQPSTMKEVPET
jgi:RNA polymerase sigma-70 factor (ECF subfamily)